jgi:aspartate 1-decarboxylase
MCLNGAAARKVEIGDKIIVIAYASYSEKELEHYEPTVVLVDENNNITAVTTELVGSDHV